MVVCGRGKVSRPREGGEGVVTITKAYATARRKRAYGNSVYRCLDCGFEAWGAAVNYHELHFREHRGMVNLDTLVGQVVADPWDESQPVGV